MDTVSDTDNIEYSKLSWYGKLMGVGAEEEKTDSKVSNLEEDEVPQESNDNLDKFDTEELAQDVEQPEEFDSEWDTFDLADMPEEQTDSEHFDYQEVEMPEEEYIDEFLV